MRLIKRLRKVKSGGLYLNNNTTYFVQPEGISNMNAAAFTGTVTSPTLSNVGWAKVVNAASRLVTIDKLKNLIKIALMVDVNFRYHTLLNDIQAIINAFLLTLVTKLK